MKNLDNHARTWTSESGAKIIVYLMTFDVQECHYLYFRYIVGYLF
jgi:hypothetical protein